MKKFLNLGCGGLIHPEMFNTDLEDWPGLDMVLDASKVPYPFEDQTWDEIVNSHMIEHIEEQKVLPMLKEWYRILKPEGKVFVDVPDLEETFRLWVEGKYEWDIFLRSVYGMSWEREGMGHKWGYRPQSLIKYFKNAGFKNVQQFDSDDYHVKMGIPTFRIGAMK